MLSPQTVHLIIKYLCWALKQFTWLSSTCVESSKSSLNYQVPVLSPQSHEGVLLCAFVKLRRATVSLYAFFWVIPRRLNFICGRFGTLCSIFMGRYAHLPAYEVGTDSVPKRRHIKFRRRGITQKKAYNIQDTAKVWNRLLAWSCLSVCPHVTTGLPLDGFPWNWIFEFFNLSRKFRFH